MIADFQMKDKIGRPRFFQKIFLIANTKFEIILGIFFLKFSNMNMSFNEETFTWRTYTTNKALPTTKQVQIINKKDFIIAALDTNNEMFIVHMTIQK